MIRARSVRGLQALRTGLTRLAVSLLAALVTSVITATLLVGVWVVSDGLAALPDAPYGWLGVLMVTLVFGTPATVLFGVVVAPLAFMAGRVHPRWRLLLCLVGGGVLVFVTTTVHFMVLGVLGGFVYAQLEPRILKRVL